MRPSHAIPFAPPPPPKLRLVTSRPEEEPLTEAALDVEDEWIIVRWIEDLQRAKRQLPPER